MDGPTLDELIARVDSPVGDRFRQDDDRCHAACALDAVREALRRIRGEGA